MMNSDHYLLRARYRDGDIRKLELPGLANSDQLERFHCADSIGPTGSARDQK
jgi:hypothetical protein